MHVAIDKWHDYVLPACVLGVSEGDIAIQKHLLLFAAPVHMYPSDIILYYIYILYIYINNYSLY